MGVAAEIGEHGVRPGEGTLGVDHPLDSGERRQMGCEGVGVLQAGEGVEEAQAAGLMGGGQLFEDEAADRREGARTGRK